MVLFGLMLAGTAAVALASGISLCGQSISRVTATFRSTVMAASTTGIGALIYCTAGTAAAFGNQHSMWDVGDFLTGNMLTALGLGALLSVTW